MLRLRFCMKASVSAAAAAAVFLPLILLHRVVVKVGINLFRRSSISTMAVRLVASLLSSLGTSLGKMNFNDDGRMEGFLYGLMTLVGEPSLGGSVSKTSKPLKLVSVDSMLSMLLLRPVKDNRRVLLVLMRKHFTAQCEM